MRSSFRPYTAAEEGHWAIGGLPLTRSELERGVPTVTTTAEELAEARKEGSSPAGPPVPESTAATGACARDSVTRDALASLRTVTQSAGLAVRFGAGMLNKPGSLVHAQPPTFAQARDRHHECAGHFGSPLVKALRLLWGYLHLLVLKPALNLAEWITESPARFVITLAVSAVIWFFA